MWKKHYHNIINRMSGRAHLLAEPVCLVRKAAIIAGMSVFFFPSFAQTFASSTLPAGYNAGNTPQFTATAQPELQTPLSDVLADLEKKYDVRFGFSSRVLKNKFITTDNVRNDAGPLEDVLHDILDPLDLSFEKIDDRHYAIYESNKKDADRKKSSRGQKGSKSSANPFLEINGFRRTNFRPVEQQASAWQAINVSGHVTSQDDGLGLPGTNVILKGTAIGTVTDADGFYALDVPNENAVLIFSSIGYQTQEVAVNGRTVIDMVMISDITQLSEVVVIGYGTQKKADVTGSIAGIKADVIEERPLFRVDQALVGQMAGVRVKQTSGLPGKGFSIQVRGSGNLTTTSEPLYVVDGFPLEILNQNESGGFASGNPLDNINPNDIESITVLKDAASAAIYGSRAANGVVLITTKKGIVGKPKITFSTYRGWNETAKKLDMLNSEEWIDRSIEMINAAWVASGPGRTADQPIDERRAILGLGAGQYNTGLMYDERWLDPDHEGLVFIDWQDEMFRKGIVQNYEVSAQGGNEFVKYYVSGGYLDQEGIAIGVGYKRFSGRANIDVQASDKLKFGLNISPSYAIASDPGVEGKDQQMHIAVSLAPVSEANVGLDVNVGDNLQYRWGGSRNSPVRVAENSIGDTKISRTLANLYAQYDLIEGLNFKTSINFDNSDSQTKAYRPGWVSGGSPAARATSASGSFTGYRRQTFVNENTLTYARTFNSVHHVNILAGHAYNTTKIDNFGIYSTGGFKTDFINTLNDAFDINAGRTNTTETKNVLVSYFGRVQYNYNERYLLSASLRRDGSSRFGRDTKWGTFPSASVGWRVSEESFMDNVTLVDELKLRASWGVSGTNNAKDYEQFPLLVAAPYTFNGQVAIGQVPGNSPNPLLSWEESGSWNVGFDVGIFNNRLFTSLDYYTRTNSLILMDIPVPTASGFRNAFTNVAKLRNTGWELEISSRNRFGDLGWNASVNLSHNVNEVLATDVNNAQFSFNGGFDIDHRLIRVGEAANSIWVVQQVGILSEADIATRSDGNPDNDVALYGNQTVGDPKYQDQLTVDTNGDGKPDARDGVINADDRVIVGHPNPDYVWGFSNTFTYKGFDLSFLIQGQWGGSIYSMFGRAVDRTGQGFVDNALGIYRDRWRSPEDPGAGERGKAYATFGRIKNTDWLWSSDYWRVRNITLGYNLGNLLTKTKTISNARIYITAENWFGGDKYKGGFNPEATNTNGEDYGAFPLPKSVIMGLNVTF